MWNYQAGILPACAPYPVDAILSDIEAPNELKVSVAKMFSPGGESASGEETLLEMAQVIDYVCRKCFLEPKIVDEPEADDEISLLDLSMGDKRFVFEWAMQGVQALRNFREEAQTDVAYLDANAGNEQTSE